MDHEIQFINQVIIPYKVEEFLAPKQDKLGEVKYGLISILKENINSCYNTIDEKFKPQFINYINDFLTVLNVRIKNKRDRLKSIKKSIKKTKTNHDDLVFQLQIEEYIYSYLRNQRNFLKKWLFMKEYNNDESSINKKIPNSYKWHVLITPLVNGSINEIYQNYGDQIEAKELSTIIISKLNLETTVENIRPYIQSSFTSKTNSRKNLFGKEKIKKIIAYCKKKEIKITDAYFLKKVKDLKLDLY